MTITLSATSAHDKIAISPSAAKLLLVLAKTPDIEKGIQVSYNSLAQTTGLSDSCVWTGVKRLKTSRLLNVVHPQQGDKNLANRYQLTDLGESLIEEISQIDLDAMNTRPEALPASSAFRLTNAERRCAIALAEFVTEGRTSPTYFAIAKRARVSEPVVSNTLNKLKAQGMLHVNRRPGVGKSNVYEFTSAGVELISSLLDHEPAPEKNPVQVIEPTTVPEPVGSSLLEQFISALDSMRDALISSDRHVHISISVI